MKKACPAVLLCVVCFFPLSEIVGQENHPDPAHNWAYSGEHGPEHWGDLSSEFSSCSAGEAQSPIDIRDPHPAQLPPIKFSYQASPLRIINNGHTIQINYVSGSTITVRGKTYELVQFHFHHPSEEKISGQPYPMVVHLVHKDKDGKLAVVAVLIEAGSANQLISTLWDNLPSEQGKELDLDRVQIDATDLLPTNHSYYTYAGSLTTPPCSEGVTWYVLQMPKPISKAQIDKFATIYPLNARPIQPLNGRIVQKSK
jgi:carbonic anhydrase